MRSGRRAHVSGTSTGDGETTQSESTSPSIGGEGITYNKAPAQPNICTDGSQNSNWKLNCEFLSTRPRPVTVMHCFSIENPAVDGSSFRESLREHTEPVTYATEELQKPMVTPRLAARAESGACHMRSQVGMATQLRKLRQR